MLAKALCCRQLCDHMVLPTRLCNKQHHTERLLSCVLAILAVNEASSLWARFCEMDYFNRECVCPKPPTLLTSVARPMYRVPTTDRDMRTWVSILPATAAYSVSASCGRPEST